MTTSSDGSAWQDLAGAPPPQLLHRRPVRDPEEVLVLTYACDLSFVEDVCVRQAHAAGARVTVVYDADRLLGGHGGTGPIQDYVPVPVLCRSGGAFHPKLVVIASATDAVVSIGSGNATTAGWHHNAEVWTHIRADGPTIPVLVGDLAAWLRRLPDQLWTDHIGRDRLYAVADLLTARPVQAQPDEPRLLTNDQTPIVDQLPPSPVTVDQLTVASPFFDPPATALARLINLVRPAQVRLLLTRDVQCDPSGIDRALSRVSAASVTTPVGTRYHHGKVIEWRSSSGGVLVTGSANCTQAALMRTMTDAGGNCELALLQEVSESLLDSVDARESALDDSELRIRDGNDDDRPPGPRLRVLAIRLLADRIEATILVSTGPPPDHLVIDLAGQPHTLPYTAGQPPLHTYTLAGQVAHDRCTATVRTDSGEFIADALITDIDRALTRITRPSPLEAMDLSSLIRDEQQLRALFNALEDLASVRTATSASRQTAPDRRAHEEERIRSVVGPALLCLALGRDTESAPPLADDDDVITSEEILSDGDTIRPVPATVATASPGSPVPTVTVAIGFMECPHREYLRRWTTTLVERSADWPLRAQLAAYRIVLIVTAAGLWPHPEDWAWIVHDGLYSLLCAEEDDAFAPEHAALAMIGLVALRQGHLSCESDSELAEAFDGLRAEYRDRDYRDWLRAAPDELIDRYASALSGATFGPRFNGSDIRDDLDWLVSRHPIDDAVDTITESFGPAERSDDGSVIVHTIKDPRRITLAVLDQLQDFPDTHVIVRTSAGLEHHGWWNGRRLLLLTPTTGGWQATVWPKLLTGIAGYPVSRALPAPARTILITSIDSVWTEISDWQPSIGRRLI